MSLETATLDWRLFDFLAKFVGDRSAIVLDSSKQYLLESRLMPVVREYGWTSLADLVTALQKPGNRQLSRQVIDAITTNETSFFRDIHPFEALKTEIIPELIRQRGRERTLHIWSNACSSGQGIYSIAMLLREHFPMLAQWNVRLFASDLSSTILAKAREGIFNQTEVNRGLPMPMLLRYFTKRGLQWQIKDEIRSSIEFLELNLVETWPPSLPVMDIIFLRNVLIYFALPTKAMILNRAHRWMRPDGYLFLGGAETNVNIETKLNRSMIGKATVYRPQ